MVLLITFPKGMTKVKQFQLYYMYNYAIGKMENDQQVSNKCRKPPPSPQTKTYNKAVIISLCIN